MRQTIVLFYRGKKSFIFGMVTLGNARYQGVSKIAFFLHQIFRRENFFTPRNSILLEENIPPRVYKEEPMCLT